MDFIRFLMKFSVSLSGRDWMMDAGDAGETKKSLVFYIGIMKKKKNPSSATTTE